MDKTVIWVTWTKVAILNLLQGGFKIALLVFCGCFLSLLNGGYDLLPGSRTLVFCWSQQHLICPGRHTYNAVLKGLSPIEWTVIEFRVDLLDVRLLAYYSYRFLWKVSFLMQYTLPQMKLAKILNSLPWISVIPFWHVPLALACVIY